MNFDLLLNPMLCSENQVLLDVLQKIKKSGKGIVFIVTDTLVVKGVITDGDVRNLLLNGHQLQEPIKQNVRKKFVFAYEDENISDIAQKTNEDISVLPIVDRKMRYVDYFEYRHQVYLPVAMPELRGNELKYLTDAFLSTWISSSGAYIEKFENAFATFCQTQYAVAVSNGTVALHLALLALDIGPGDEVIVPDLTFAATINAVLHAQAKPVIVDVETDSWCIDPTEVEKAVTKNTKAIIVVHLYGQPCDMKAIMAVAKKHHLKVIEDCAEAHGATIHDKKVGSFGDIGCFSFYGNKVITTGEGGMCVTNSKKLSDRVRLFKDHGMSKKKKYWHDVVGYNYRMTNLQAALGLAQMERVDEILTERDHLETRYRSYLEDLSLITLQRNDLPGRRKITWLMSALVKKGKRNALIKALKEEGIDSRPFFYALSSMPLYKPYLFSNTVSSKLSAQGINFPTNSGILDESLETIRSTIKGLT